jgi:HEAT repeat protein
MTDPTASVPPVYALLAKTRNVAADRALVSALAQLEAPYRRVALTTLLRRERPAGLAQLVARFPKFDAGLQAMVLSRADWLSAGLRVAIASDQMETRLAAVTLIRRSGSVKLAYLLAGALSQPCTETRARAAEALRHLVSDHVDSPERGNGDADSTNGEGAVQHLAEAVRQGLASWDAHLRSEVIAAAVWLSGPLEEYILARVSRPRSKLGRALNEAVHTVLDARGAGYLLRALRSSVLRGEAAAWIERSQDDAIMLALIDEAWLLADPQITRALSRVRRLRWLEAGIHSLTHASVQRAENAAAFIAATGLNIEAKVGLWQAMATSGESALARAGLWQLLRNEAQESSTALRCVARRGDPSGASVAERELRRRAKAGLIQPGFSTGAVDDGGDPSTFNSFDAYWSAFERLDVARQVQLGRALRSKLPDFDRQVRMRLGTGDPADCVLALRIVRMTGIEEQVDRQLFALAHSPEPLVRSAAVSTLAGLNHPSAMRLLRNALNDPDDRVQANAIEALDRLEAANFIGDIKPKLDATNPRVRANAVKSLLKLELREAVDALLAMFDAESRADRLSALWVVESLQLQSLTDRLAELARSDPDAQVRYRAAQVAASVGLPVSPDWPAPVPEESNP